MNKGSADHILLHGSLLNNGKLWEITIMVDSGATTNFIDSGSAASMTKVALEKEENLTLFDGKESSAGKIKEAVKGILSIGDAHSEEVELRVTTLGDYDAVLGLPWLRKHNPTMNWKDLKIKIGNHQLNGITAILDPEEKRRRALLKVGGGEITKPAEEIVPAYYHKYLRVFERGEADGLPPHRNYDCAINLIEGAVGKNQRMYPLNPLETEVLKVWIDELLRKGYIRQSDSTMGSPVFFAKAGNGEIRPVIDYRALNEITKKDNYPIPLTTQLVDQLQEARFFTKMDLRVGYNQVRIKEGDEWKAAFNCRYGKFEPLVMTLGLCNAPSVFQRFMNDILHDFIDKGVVIYLDDILIYAKTLEELRRITCAVIERLMKHKLFLKPEKCEWEKQEVGFLGLRVSSRGLEMEKEKLERIGEWPVPKSVKQVQEFLGFANFYRRFIVNFSKIGRPIFNLLKKDKKFEWNEKAEAAFNALKAEFQKAPMLMYPDPEKQFFVEADASDYATGGVLSQIGDDGLKHPIAFYSKSLAPAERNYDIFDKELLAIMRILGEWRHHLEGSKHKVIVLTDHKNLEYFLTKKDLSSRHIRWAEKLAHFDLVIQYRPGKQATVPDALSRRADHIPEGEKVSEYRIFTEDQFLRATVSVGIEDERLILDKIKASYKDDSKASTSIAYLEGKRNVIDDYKWDGEYLRYKGRIYVPDKKEIKRGILKIYHDSKLAGHQGQKGTLELVSRGYYWPGMSQFVTSYVDGCDLCQRIKVRRHAPYGTLKPLEIPDENWTDISYDFIGELPESEKKNAILVVVDRKSKGAHFIACTTSETAESTARLFLDNVWKLHGLPKRTVSDRGTQFNSHFMKRLYELLGIQPGFSTAFHPESDGQTERVNQILEDYLRFFVSHRQNDWVQMLPMAEFAYNNSVSASTGVSPFKMMYGSHPRMTADMPRSESVPAAEELAKTLKQISEEANAMLKMSSDRYKGNADKGRIEQPGFKVGDRVWLNRKNISTDRPTSKLDYRRIGPYKIKEQIGERAFRLDLPKTLKIHNVFHVSMLEPWKEDEHGREPIPPEPVILEEGQEEYEVEKVLNSRIHRGNVEYLIRWKGYGPEEDSWEPKRNVANAPELISKFYENNPNAPKEGYKIPARRNRQRN